MYMIVSIDCKFKTNHENIENVLEHFGLRKIQSSLYVGNLDNSERKELCEKISEIIRQTDSVLIIPICQNCYSIKLTDERLINLTENSNMDYWETENLRKQIKEKVLEEHVNEYKEGISKFFEDGTGLTLYVHDK